MCVYLSIYLSICLSTYLTTYPSIHPSISLPIYMRVGAPLSSRTVPVNGPRANAPVGRSMASVDGPLAAGAFWPLPIVVR